MMSDKASQAWAELEQLEDKAHGSFAGGLLLAVDANALSCEPKAIPASDPSVVDTILDSLDVPMLHIRRAENPDAMKKEMSQFFRENAEVANLAARGFEALSDDAAKSIYEEFIELQEKAKRRG
ncbi:MAG TPA: hypothetical protein PKY51_10000 [Fimbriimonadaceae bacterium]|jgi:hypothetical protein|nr:hypothetical protein [Fimbriimonadaceae bacterium]